MGIVLKESYQNTVTLMLAISIGAVNTLFLYVYYLDTSYYGLLSFLLSTSLILKPFISLGVNYSIVKFFSGYTDKVEKDKFLSTVLWLPLLIIVPLGIVAAFFYQQWSDYLSEKNPMVKNYSYLIFWVAIAITYFDIFYAWARVHFKSVLGNVLKELFVRVITTLLLVLVSFDVITEHQFVLFVAASYGFQMLVMLFFAFHLYRPKFVFEIPSNFKDIFQYSIYIILAGSAASILLDIDKFMIPQKEAIEQVAFYAVAVYIGTIIEIPGRAMSQIVQPLTAKALNENNTDGVLSLYQKSSINLLIASGLIFILVISNIDSLYALLPEKYTGGFWVVLMIACAKLYHMFLGNNGSIISNSKYYKILLPYGVAMALMVVFLNFWLIGLFGINGAALSTLIVVFVFNSVKLIYVKRKFKIQPTTTKTWLTLLAILCFTLGGYFLNFPFHPVFNIMLESLLLSVVYIFVVLQFQFSGDISLLCTQSLSKLKK
ncbi:oligosaccharide flippase family protein [Wenyingzhuangia sp. 2_MG-2023]|uniref:oligosaccharide flippase family protein n=1 Tax=Wenyingzhuangia sp. 2_MG-2023 TaxID=3062639 RepID=UPI0026E45719|nr:oligosaccharide flippase family protein [Wenyingzhuangia sp. 2_MG-2023]MDO6737798.1 oligosaccharide flippase family protein [Wenyingzhuangia sp. 2_MG-2023]